MYKLDVSLVFLKLVPADCRYSGLELLEHKTDTETTFSIFQRPVSFKADLWVVAENNYFTKEHQLLV